MKCLNELQIRGQAFRDDWCEVEPIYCCFFSRRISELASSLAAESKFANFQSPTQSSHPHPAPQHCRTAELRVVGIETSRTESLTEKPFPESNDLAMSRLRIRETIIDQSLRWPSSFTRRVCSKKKELLYCCTQQYCCNSPRVLRGHWVHTLGHLEIDKPPS